MMAEMMAALPALLLRVLHGLAWLPGVLALAGLVYQAATVWAVRRFVRQPRPQPAEQPPVSVLKPLHGADPDLSDNLLSLVAQDYPMQIVFGLRDAGDPARLVAESLIGGLAAAEVQGGEGKPAVSAELVVDPRVACRNPKVANLLNMFPAARHDLLVIADADIRLPPGHMRDVVAPLLADPRVGLVTSLYVGRPLPDLWSRLGAMGVNHDFLPSALIARALGRKDGCFGATMALRREVLAEAGGLEVLADMLADDWALGAIVRRTGRGIALAARPVDITIAESGLRGLLAHEIRWGRTVALVDRLGYIASVITRPVGLALLAALLGGAPWMPLLALAALVRLWAVRHHEEALGLPRSGLAVVALRELLSFVVWAASCRGDKVWWCGRRFRIQKDGTLVAEGDPAVA